MKTTVGKFIDYPGREDTIKFAETKATCCAGNEDAVSHSHGMFCIVGGVENKLSLYRDGCYSWRLVT